MYINIFNKLVSTLCGRKLKCRPVCSYTTWMIGGYRGKRITQVSDSTGFTVYVIYQRRCHMVRHWYQSAYRLNCRDIKENAFNPK